MKKITPDDICKQYCPKKFENLTNNAICEFQLQEVSWEQKDKDDYEINLRCSKLDAYLFETIVNRIIRATENAITVMKEVFTHRRIPIVNKEWHSNDFPKYPNLPIGPGSPNTPIYPQMPLGSMWTDTRTDNSNTFKLSTDAVADTTKFPNKE